MIQLPDLFEAKLATAPVLASNVKKSFDLFEPWLEQSGMPFFPGFTDHSPRHINDVLRTAASLISDASRELLSPEDVAVLCMAILLHDCGMHLTKDGFRALVTSSNGPIISGLGDLPWRQMWKDFLSEAHRFGQDKLIAIFGNSELILVEQLNLDNLSERDCYLIGEFIRRHHARLAHEIALSGVPNTSKTSDRLDLVGFDHELRDLAGLIARSHGMSMRSTFEYLGTRYSLVPEYRHVKTPFLMAVLRIADYIQVQSERALKSLLSVRELRSPISRQEWRNHFAVRDVSPWHDDPEALFVHAAPTDVKTYLRLDSLFKDIQRELDESWATIGEVYGRYGNLAKLGLTWRRIRSNLDATEKFSRTVTYIPIKAGFDSSGPDLLKLLVGPLYDYNHRVGIRELVQNAVDACRELSDLSGNARSTNAVESEEPDVVVDVQESEDGAGWISVTDKGVGMTLDTVTRYFLVAGASFRNSDVWKRRHMDDDGQVRVLRGGRFGVGALAAFLLGEEIKVTTRHADRPESEGLEFTARIDDPVIELRKCIAPAGTSIRVRISDPDIFEEIRPRYPAAIINPDEVNTLGSWDAVDWFVQKSPAVFCRWHGYNLRRDEYDPGDDRISDEPDPDDDRICGEYDPDDVRIKFRGEFRPPRGDLVPSPGASDPDWNELNDSSPYKAVFWRYRKPEKSSDDKCGYVQTPRDEVTLNGIRVQELGRYDYSTSKIALPSEALGFGPKYFLRRPSMAIFDPAGICPINLQRSAISFDRMGLDERLGTELLKAHLKPLVGSATNFEQLASIRKLCSDLAKGDGVTYEGQVMPICATSSGVFLADPALFHSLKINVLFLVDIKNIPASVSMRDMLKDGEALLLRTAEHGIQANLGWFRGIFADDQTFGWYGKSIGLPQVERRLALSVMPNKKWTLANEKGKVKQQILASLESRQFNEKQTLVTSNLCEYTDTVLTRVREIVQTLGDEAEVAAWMLDIPQQSNTIQSLLCRVWLEMFSGPYIN